MRREANCLAAVALLLSGCGGVARAPGDGAGGGGTIASEHQAENGGELAGAGSGPSAVGVSGTTSIAIMDAGLPSTDSGTESPPMRAAVACASPTPGAHGGGYVACSDGSLRRASAA